MRLEARIDRNRKDGLQGQEEWAQDPTPTPVYKLGPSPGISLGGQNEKRAS